MPPEGTQMPPVATKSKTTIFNIQSQSMSQGHSPWCPLKQFNELSMDAKYEVSIS